MTSPVTAGARIPAEFTIAPVHPLLGAEIVGLDLDKPVDDGSFAVMDAALERHGVLIFRGQDHLSPQAQVGFSRRFGPLEVHVQKTYLVPGYPELFTVSNVIENGRRIGLADAGRYWHADLSYLAEPSLASLLAAKELPPPGIGDTLFASQTAAYDALDEATKQRLKGLHAVHDYSSLNRRQIAKEGVRPALSAGQARTVPPVAHPVVRTLGDGRKALFVSEGFTTHIVGLPEAESRELLDRLFRHQTQDRFIYRHSWRPGDALLWDNRATLHYATGCPAELRRTLYRATIRGPVPTLAA